MLVDRPTLNIYKIIIKIRIVLYYQTSGFISTPKSFSSGRPVETVRTIICKVTSSRFAILYVSVLKANTMKNYSCSLNCFCWLHSFWKYYHQTSSNNVCVSSELGCWNSRNIYYNKNFILFDYNSSRWMFRKKINRPNNSMLLIITYIKYRT